MKKNNFQQVVKCVLGLSLILFVTACNKSDDSVRAPGDFDLLTPADGVTDADILPVLTWNPANDSDGSTVTYTVQMGPDAGSLTTVATGLDNTTYTLTNNLSYLSSYTWQVTATDGNGNSTNANNVFSFTTRNISNGTEATTAAGFSARINHQSLMFDNKMWVIGGSTYDSSKNDVWYSTDGVTWIQATAAAAFSARSAHQSVVFDNKMWVIGGYAVSQKNDVWYSTDGVTWIQTTAAAAFSARAAHQSVVFDNKMWIIGGTSDGLRKNDVWYSTDGVTWTQATAAADFSARTNPQIVVYDNKIWIIAGYDGSYKNDVWYSTDGVTWTEATSSAAFSERVGHQSVVFDNKMWIIGAGSPDGSTKNDIWFSTNGITWTQAIAAADFSPRSLHQCVVFDNKIWVIAGYDGSIKSDVWYLD